MSFPSFYSIETLSGVEWFGMLANEKVSQVDSERGSGHKQDEETYIYEVSSDDYFSFKTEIFYLKNKNGEEIKDDQGNKIENLNPLLHLKKPGIYYMRGSKKDAEKLSLSCQVNRLSFSKLVYLSDVFYSIFIKSNLPNHVDLSALVDRGEASRYFQREFASVKSEGLQIMREKVWRKYFNQGVMGWIRRFFSALANLFIKYNRYIETGIYWPGSSCNYADKVIDRLNRIKRIFLRQAYEASEKVLSKRLDIPLDHLKEMNFDEIKATYRTKVLRIHPDKNKALDAAEQFNRLNRVWKDFEELSKLKEKWEVEMHQEEGLEVEKETLEVSFLEDKPIAANRFKGFLSLPAPIPVN